MLHRLRNWLTRDHAVHLAGIQLALVTLLSAGLALAAAPHGEPRLMTARLAGGPALAATPAGTEKPDEAADTGVIRLQDLDPDQARRWNAAHPIAPGANPAARPFKLSAPSVIDEARAVDCMTAAIYYEAAFEGVDGQRAVAQVVLNRLRHPAFPKTVCGVVLQGAERRTGCQFTFTCDGALAREPDPVIWARARKVAEAALNGYVMKKVGNATHYHADYVAPYWSPTLVKVAVVGQHIFYRWTGGWGLPPAFAGRYAGSEAKGVQMAKLDNLSRSAGKLALATNSESAPVAVAEAAVAAAPTLAASSVQIAEVAAPAPPPAAAEPPRDLDWQGRPKARLPSRVAMPSSF